MRRRTTLFLDCFMFLCVPALLLSQTDPSKIAAARAKGRQRIEQLLVSSGLTIDRQMPGSTQAEQQIIELRLTWDVYATPQGHIDPANQSVSRGKGLAIASSKRFPGRIGRDRYPQLSSNTLLVVGVDSNNKVYAWTIARDPRVLRAETPGASGELSGQILHASRVEMMVALNHHPSISVFRIYEPIWSTRPATLRFLGSVPF